MGRKLGKPGRPGEAVRAGALAPKIKNICFCHRISNVKALAPERNTAIRQRILKRERNRQLLTEAGEEGNWPVENRVFESYCQSGRGDL